MVRWVEPRLVLLNVKAPVLCEVAAELCRPRLEHCFGYLGGPAHARPLHPVFYQVFTGSLYHIGGDGPAMAEILVTVGTWNIHWFPRGCSSNQACPQPATDIPWLAYTIAWMNVDLLAI
jgi:hypothetical protein